MEALTEASFTTHKSGDAALAGLAEDEQVRASSTFIRPAAAGLGMCCAQQHGLAASSSNSQ
jgi:hypothetical protein